MSWQNCDVIAFGLTGIEGSYQTGKNWGFTVTGSGHVASSEVVDLERLWDALPDGEGARCHNPELGFEVLRNDTLVMRTAICFHCSNISIRRPDGDDWRTFDPSSGPSLALKALLDSALARGLT